MLIFKLSDIWFAEIWEENIDLLEFSVRIGKCPDKRESNLPMEEKSQDLQNLHIIDLQVQNKAWQNVTHTF